MSEAIAASSSTETVMETVENVEKKDEFVEPDIKRRKVSTTIKLADGTEHKLEDRLGGIFCCTVCLDLPKAAVYQCLNGHLMCAGCLTHLLADARLRDETATCPNCRVAMSNTYITRNLAVENAVSELPSECKYCNKQFPRNTLERHEESQCDERASLCKYNRIGCTWRGPLHKRTQHHSECSYPKKSGEEVMDSLKIYDQKQAAERLLYENIFDLLTYEKINFNDLQLKPYHTEEFVHKLFYETSRFSAFNKQWVVKAQINNSQKDPTQSSERDMTYQLILKTKATTTLSLHYFVVKGPFGDTKIKPRIYKHDFTELESEGPYVPLSLPDSAECNRLLADKTINLRLFMFSSSI